MAYGDPFDAAGADLPPQQAGGVSPDFWRNLAMFGSSMALGANSRTPQGFLAAGPGFAGPFAAGIQGGMQNSMDVAKLRSNLALQNAQTQGVSADTLLKQFQIPFMQQKMRMLSDPRVMDSLFGDLGVAPGAAPGPQSSAAPASSDVQTKVAQSESGGNSSVVNPQGFSGKYQFGKPALISAGVYTPAQGENTSANGDWQGTFNIAPFKPMSYSEWLSNPKAQDATWSAHVANLNQEIQNRGLDKYAGQTVAGVPIDNNTLIGMMHAGGPAGTQRFLETGGQYNPADANGVTIADAGRRLASLNWGGNRPQQTGQAAPAGNVATDASAAPAQQQRVQVAQAGNGPIPLPGAAPAQQPTSPGAPQQQPAPATAAGHMSPGYITPQEAFQRADAYQRKAVALQAIGLDATPATQRAQQWQDYGQKQLLQQTANQTIRGPGSASINPASGKIIQSPLEYEITGPDMRTYRITQNAVETGEPYTRPQGVPSWAPPGTLSIALAKPSPGETEAAKEASMDAFGEKARSQYASAAGTMRSMEDLDQQMDRLNASGPSWYNTGAGADFKLSLGKAINAISRSSGAPDIFDPDKLASGEDILKQSKLAGMQTLQAFFGGSREAASIVQSTQAAVPNLENTPFGGKLVLNGIKEAARWQMDQHAFMTNWYYSHAGNMVGADVAFTQQYAPQKYTRRAISQVRPVEIPGNDPKELNRFLPGTRFTVKGDETHSVREVPGQADVQLQMPDQHPSLAAPVQ